MTLCFCWDKCEPGRTCNNITLNNEPIRVAQELQAQSVSSSILEMVELSIRIHCCQARNIKSLNTVQMKHLPWLKYMYERIKDQKKCLLLHLVLCCYMYMYVDVHITSIRWLSYYMHVIMSLVWTRLKEHNAIAPGLNVDHLIQSPLW